MFFKAILSYDGTRYFGWQKTKMGPSVQEALEQAIWQITGEKRFPEAASRTDRGVHAEGQTVHFMLDRSVDPARLQRGLNAVLPLDIRIVELEEAPPGFHSTLDATGKEYRYRLSLGPVQEPIHRLYAWHFRYPLHLDAMRQAANFLIGTHDFRAFAGEQTEKNPLCTLQAIEFEELPENQLQFRLLGDRFLYKMARTIAGTLVSIGAGKLPADCIPSLLASRDRKRAGATAPAHGLTLHRVFYRKLSA